MSFPVTRLCLTVLATTILAAADIPSPAAIDARVRAALSETRANGMAIAVIDDGRVQYVQAPPAHGLTEVRMDAQLTGDYRSLAQFLNGLERNRSFFLITQIALSGQQSGIVNLRIRFITYLREPMPASAATTAGGAQ